MVALDSPLDRLYVVGGGWDEALEDDAGTIGLTLDDDTGWVPFARVPGPTPRRGAGLAILGRTLFLAGGETGLRQRTVAGRLSLRDLHPRGITLIDIGAGQGPPCSPAFAEE